MDEKLQGSDLKFDGSVVSVVSTIATVRGGAEVRTFVASPQVLPQPHTKDRAAGPPPHRK